MPRTAKLTTAAHTAPLTEEDRAHIRAQLTKDSFYTVKDSQKDALVSRMVVGRYPVTRKVREMRPGMLAVLRINNYLRKALGMAQYNADEMTQIISKRIGGDTDTEDCTPLSSPNEPPPKRHHMDPENEGVGMNTEEKMTLPDEPPYKRLHSEITDIVRDLQSKNDGNCEKIMNVDPAVVASEILRQDSPKHSELMIANFDSNEFPDDQGFVVPPEWHRPAFSPETSYDTEGVYNFMNVDVKFTMGPRNESCADPQRTPVNNNYLPVMHVFGVDRSGSSVLLNVHGYFPYMYIAMRDQSPDEEVDDPDMYDECDVVRNLLEKYIALKCCRGRYTEVVVRRDDDNSEESRIVYTPRDTSYMDIFGQSDNLSKLREKTDEFICSTEIMHKRSLMGYSNKKGMRVMRITVVNPHHLYSLRELFEKYIFTGSNDMSARPPHLNGNDVQNLLSIFRPPMFECNVDHSVRFMTDVGMQGFTWVSIPKDKAWFTPRSDSLHSTTSVEIDVHYSDMITRDYEQDAWASIAPIRTLSFDIECRAEVGVFPNAHNPLHYVIEIACDVSVYGRSDPLCHVVFNYGKSARGDIAKDVRIYEFSDMRYLFSALKRFVVDVDPDIITVRISSVRDAIRRARSIKSSTRIVPFM